VTARGFALFDTAIGRCGIAWSGRGVVGVQLPEEDQLETRVWPLRRFPDAREAPPPPDVARAIDGIVALLRGEASDLSTVALDMEGVPPFHRRVYEVARAIPPGKTLAYGDIAARLGAAGACLPLDARAPQFEAALENAWARLLDDRALRHSLSQVAADLCDGRGAERTAEAVLGLI
jgi:methylated-DNA-[protein]-cysteine S-methyltransferase